MHDGEAMLAGIKLFPDDDMPRLAYADWLDEHEQHDRAAYIRKGCEYARWFDEHEPAPRAIDARIELADLLSKWFPSHWPIPPNPRSIPPYSFLKDSIGAVVHGDSERPGGRTVFTRGFARKTICTGVDWVCYADAILAEHPVVEVSLTTMPDVSNARHAIDFGQWSIRGISTPVAAREVGEHATAQDIARLILRKRWPGVKTWHLPPQPQRWVTIDGVPISGPMAVPLLADG